MASASDTVAVRPRRSWSGWFKSQLRNIAPFLTLLFLVIFFSAASPTFLSVANFSNILSQVSITAIIAVGLTFVILCAEIDLSVAAIANVAGIAVAYFTLQESYVNIANVPCRAGWRSSSRWPPALR
jgi:ribose transport system permease protein